MKQLRLKLYFLMVAASLSAPSLCFAQETAPKPVDNSAPAVQSNAPQKAPTPMEIAFGAYQRGYYLTAFNHALPLAEKGDANAQTLIALIYDEGLGVPKNPKEALAWYRLGANGGNKEAQFAYALMLSQGRATERNDKMARLYFQKAADQGHPSAQFNYAEIIAKEKGTHKDYEKALPYYQEAAKAGIAEAQYVLALIYQKGLGLPQADLKQARTWMSAAAVGGLTIAQLEFGIWLVNGIGGKAEEDIGAQWLLRAAQKGNVIAQNRIAKLYFLGLGVKKNPVEGAKWHLLAKHQGKEDLELDAFLAKLSDEEKQQAQSALNKLIALNPKPSQQ